MKTWDDLSDFEINKTIFPFTKDFGECKDIMQKKNPNRSAVMWGDGARWFEFDGCNNPADMWPIIYNSGMSIQAPDEYFDEWHTSKLGVNISYCHKNPLRAAAIVFLMMNGVNPE